MAVADADRSRDVGASRRGVAGDDAVGDVEHARVRDRDAAAQTTHGGVAGDRAVAQHELAAIVDADGAGRAAFAEIEVGVGDIAGKRAVGDRDVAVGRDDGTAVEGGVAREGRVRDVSLAIGDQHRAQIGGVAGDRRALEHQIAAGSKIDRPAARVELAGGRVVGERAAADGERDVAAGGDGTAAGIVAGSALVGDQAAVGDGDVRAGGGVDSAAAGAEIGSGHAALDRRVGELETAPADLDGSAGIGREPVGNGQVADGEIGRATRAVKHAAALGHVAAGVDMQPAAEGDPAAVVVAVAVDGDVPRDQQLALRQREGLALERGGEADQVGARRGVRQCHRLAQAAQPVAGHHVLSRRHREGRHALRSSAGSTHTIGLGRRARALRSSFHRRADPAVAALTAARSVLPPGRDQPGGQADGAAADGTRVRSRRDAGGQRLPACRGLASCAAGERHRAVDLADPPADRHERRAVHPGAAARDRARVRSRSHGAPARAARRGLQPDVGRRAAAAGGGGAATCRTTTLATASSTAAPTTTTPPPAGGPTPATTNATTPAATSRPTATTCRGR